MSILNSRSSVLVSSLFSWTTDPDDCPLCDRNMQNVHSGDLHTTEVEQYKHEQINRYVTSTEKTSSFEGAVIHTGC